MAVEFAKLIESNLKFELFVPQHLGLVCFRLKVKNFILVDIYYLYWAKYVCVKR